MQRLLLTLALLAFGAMTAFSQDIHFSQFYASPLTLNPVLTGFHQGDYRVAGIYRNQWNSVSSPFVTFAASYDMKVLQEKLGEDVFGVGGMISNDRSSGGALNKLTIAASASYHKALGKKHRLGLGIQLGYVQNSLDAANLNLPNQFDPAQQDFDQAIMSGENFDDNQGYIDFNTGLMWSFIASQKITVYQGGAIYHVIPPKESFLGDDNKLNSRFVVNGGARFQVAKKVYLTPAYIFMLQNKAQELNFGGAVEYHFGTPEDVIVSLGGWYRLDDAPIISASVEYMRVRAGFSYDINTSDLVPASNNRGAYEISLIYIGMMSKAAEGPILVPCPRL